MSSSIDNQYFTKTNVLATNLRIGLSSRISELSPTNPKQNEYIIVTNALALVKFLETGLRRDDPCIITRKDKILLALTCSIYRANLDLDKHADELPKFRSRVVDLTCKYDTQQWVNEKRPLASEEQPELIADCFFDYENKGSLILKEGLKPLIGKFIAYKIRWKLIGNEEKQKMYQDVRTEVNFKLLSGDLDKCGFKILNINFWKLFISPKSCEIFLAPITVRCIKGVRQSIFTQLPRDLVKMIIKIVNEHLLSNLEKFLEDKESELKRRVI